MRSTAKAYWSLEVSDLFAELASGPDGLSTGAAAARRAAVGPNTVEEDGRISTLRLFLRQIRSPLILILVLGATLSLVVGEWIDSTMVFVIVLGSALLGFFQEHRASRAVAELRKRLALTVRVVRDGRPCTLLASELVPGDVIRLAAGNLVPGDGVVLAAKDFLVTESSLTGESFPVEKRPGTVPATAPVSARTNAVFMGTSVRSGTADVLIVETGRRTLLGEVAHSLAGNAPEPEFAHGLRQFGYLLMRVMFVMAIFVLAINQVRDRPLLESLLFAMALCVGLSPELLPAIVSVTLSRGARDLARRGVIVARLEALEDMGAMDVLCTDKTGTLTRGTVELAGALDPQGEHSSEVLRLAYLNAAFETGIANPLDEALVAAGERSGLSTTGYVKRDEIPYDFLRRRLTVVLAEEDDPTTCTIVTKGALAQVLEICTRLSSGGSEVELDDEARGRLERFLRERGEQGFRVLGLATRRLSARTAYTREDEQQMTFDGLLLFDDPPKEFASRTLSELRSLGVSVKVITGDNRHVAAHLGRAVGLDPGALLTGAELAEMRDEALWQRAEETQLFVEVDPQQKERIVRALQARGHVVGYLGDGINDAPALHAADVGISVDTAVDVARESADVVLLAPDLDVLREGLIGGRRTFANTLKYIGITTSANFGNMLSMAIATPVLPFLPLAAKQILLNNFLSDIPSVFISTDNVDPGRLERAQRWRIHDVRRFMVVFGLQSTVFDLLSFALLLLVFRVGETLFQTTWFVISLLTELAVVLVLRTEGSMFGSRPGRLLLWSSIAVGAAALVLPYLGPFSTALGFQPMPARLVACALGIVAAYALCAEATKAWFFRAGAGRSPHRLSRE